MPANLRSILSEVRRIEVERLSTSPKAGQRYHGGPCPDTRGMERLRQHGGLSPDTCRLERQLRKQLISWALPGRCPSWEFPSNLSACQSPHRKFATRFDRRR